MPKHVKPYPDTIVLEDHFLSAIVNSWMISWQSLTLGQSIYLSQLGSELPQVSIALQELPIKGVQFGFCEQDFSLKHRQDDIIWQGARVWRRV